jgi:hypothetical protein
MSVRFRLGSKTLMLSGAEAALLAAALLKRRRPGCADAIAWADADPGFARELQLDDITKARTLVAAVNDLQLSRTSTHALDTLGRAALTFFALDTTHVRTGAARTRG